ncbi:hypothetical protein BGZ72_005399 [Mortierella alpina]|nr:hypothetical protein BGZ72_005399 [Mortierella alpina]
MVAEYQERPQDEDPPTGNISILTSRFANLRVMDSLCPMQDALSAQEHDCVSMDASWAAQISQLLNHLADKADLEEEAQGVGFATESSTGHQWLRVGSGAGHRAPRGYDSENSGLYRQLLRDWLMRLSQLSGAVFETHSGLKREVDKIRWQHNITSATSLPLRT